MTNTKSIKNDVMQQMVNGSIAEGSKPATVSASDELVLNHKQLAVIGDGVDLFIAGDEQLMEGDEKHIKVATATAKLLKPDAKTEPTFAFWELVMNTWVNVYMARMGLTNEESAKNAWYRNAKRMEKLFGLTKPAKGTKDSARMSEKRAKEQAELQAKPDSVLREEMLAYKAEDKFSQADKIKKELERREKQSNSSLIEKRKAKQSLLSSAVKKIADDALLDKLWSLIPESIKIDLAKSAK